jgi:hypothetical protein
MKLLQHTYILISLVAIMVVVQLAKISGTKDPATPITVSEKTIVITDASLDEAAPAAFYSESDDSWSFSAQVLEIKDVSIYGRTGSIARIEYVHKGKLREAWAVLKIDNYSFSDSTSAITAGDQITLRVSGDYVSSKGVDWSACPASDEFCRHASFIEGGFPTSEDYDGLTISPSNTLIYSGSVDDDWINGMLAWRIVAEH